jgi:hypothetical protein
MENIYHGQQPSRGEIRAGHTVDGRDYHCSPRDSIRSDDDLGTNAGVIGHWAVRAPLEIQA